MSVWKSIQNSLHLWGFLGVIFGCFFLIVFVIVLCGVTFYCVRRRYRRRHYIQIRTNSNSLSTSINLQQGGVRENVFTTMERQTLQQEERRKEVALLSCRFYLRSLHGYILDHQLPDIGSRMSKNWFLIRQIRSTAPTLMTMLPVSQHCRLNLPEEKQCLNRLLKVLNHMNIHQTLSIDYISDRRLIVILEPLHSRGSLKDLLYQTTPNLSWSVKYSIRRNGLKLRQVQSFGRQVLHAVLFLHQLGFEPLGQIQSGNIYLEGGIIKLSGYDGYLLGYKPRIYRHVKGFKDKIDSAMFGHLIFELSSGRELTVSQPTDKDLSAVRHDQVREVLNFIFYNEIGEIPTIEEILKHPFFCEQNSPGLEHWSYEGVRLDEEMKSMIVKSKMGKLSRGSGSAGSKIRKKNKSSKSRYPVFNQSRTSTLTPIAQSPNTNTIQVQVDDESSPDINQKKTLDSVTEIDRSPPVARSALLGDIRKGKSLRKAVTNDRSAPMLH